MGNFFVCIGYFLSFLLLNGLEQYSINNESYKEQIKPFYKDETEDKKEVEEKKFETVQQSTKEIYEIEAGITPEKLIADMIKSEDEQNWDQYWKYWESSCHVYWKNAFQDEELMKNCEWVSTVRSANLLGVAEVEVEQIPFGIRNNKTYKDITDWKAYLMAVDYTVKKVGPDFYNGVIYRIVTVGKENGEWRVVEVSEVDFRELYTLYEKCLEGTPLFDWLTEEELYIANTIREARMRGILLDGDLLIVKSISSKSDAVKDYLNRERGYPNKNWRYSKGHWHYIDDKGELVKGKWYSIDGKQHYFDEDGNEVTGWLNLSGKWYYFGLDGVMWQDKWVEDTEDGDRWYYCDSNGEMVRNTSKVINGGIYYFNEEGVCFNFFERIEQNKQETYEVEAGITPETLIAEMIECEDKRNWDQYWKYWESGSHSYWQNTFQDKELMKYCEGVTTVESADLIGITEVALEEIDPSIRKSKFYENITDWKAYFVATDYRVKKVTFSWYNGVIYRLVAVGKEEGEWRIIESSEVDPDLLKEYYFSCLRGEPLFDWLKEEDFYIEEKIRRERLNGILLDGDLSVIRNMSPNPNNIENYLSKKRSYPNKNWRYQNGKWRYIDDNGEMVKGTWYVIEGKQYYFDEEGNGVTGWLNLSGEWYYFGLDGVMWQDKWVEDTSRGKLRYEMEEPIEDYYLFTTDPNVSDIWYYCDSNGERLRNTSKIINERTYYFNKEGVCLNPFGYIWNEEIEN